MALQDERRVPPLRQQRIPVLLRASELGAPLTGGSTAGVFPVSRFNADEELRDLGSRQAGAFAP